MYDVEKVIEYIAMVGCGRIVGYGMSEIGITVFPMQMVGVMTLHLSERRGGSQNSDKDG